MEIRLRTGAVVVLTVLVLIGLTYAPAGARTGQTPTDSQMDVIVVFESHAVKNERAITAAGGTVTGGHSVDIIPVLFASVSENAIERIERKPSVDYVERDRPVRALSQTEPWGIKRINATTAASSVNESSVDIAIIDTGIDYDHEDLKNNVVWGVKTVGGGPVKYGKSQADDDNGHGTHVAGIAAAENNGLGVVGVAPQADLYAVKVLNGGGSGSLSDVIQGIDEAVKGPDHEVGTNDDGDVLSMSLGSSSDSQSLQDAVERAYNHSVLVAAAGNSGDGDNSTNEVSYPAKYDEVIAVAATNKSNETPEWSSEGKEVEVAAPGVNILSTYPDNTYETYSGTSMATPHVSGTIALMLAEDLQDGDQDTTDSGRNHSARSTLRNSTIDIELDGEDNYSGHGLILADKAVGSGASPSVNITNPSNGETVSGNVTIQVNASDAEDAEGTLDVDVHIDSGQWMNATYNDTSNRYELEWNSSSVSDGDHIIEARATDNDSNTGTDSVTVAVENTDNAPTVSFINPQDGDTVSGNVTVQIDADDDRDSTENLTVEYRVDNGAWRNATYNSTSGYFEDTWNTSSVTDGSHNLTARANDTGGNSGSVTISVTVDNGGSDSGSPTVHELNIAEVNSPNPHAEFDVTWNVSDSDGDLDTVELTLLDGNESNATEDSTTVDVSGSSATGTNTLKAKHDERSGHTYYVVLNVTDTSGNTASETKSVTEDGS